MVQEFDEGALHVKTQIEIVQNEDVKPNSCPRSKNDVSEITVQQKMTNNEDTLRFVGGPPDGGWGWMVVAASFICCAVLDGIIYSFGLFLVHLERYYGSQKGEVAWCGSLLTGMTFLSGPIAGALANKYGFRKIAITGSVLSASGLLLSTIAPTIGVMYFTFGIMGGLGFGMIYLCDIVAVGCYFTTKRALATGITLIGSGAGGFVFPPLIEALLSFYDWKGAITITAGIVLNCAVCGSILRPLATISTPIKQGLKNNYPLEVVERDNENVCETLLDRGQRECKEIVQVTNTEPGVHSLNSLDHIPYYPENITVTCNNGCVKFCAPLSNVDSSDSSGKDSKLVVYNCRKHSVAYPLDEEERHCHKVRRCDPDVASLDEERVDLETQHLGSCYLSKTTSPRPTVSSTTLSSESANENEDINRQQNLSVIRISTEIPVIATMQSQYSTSSKSGIGNSTDISNSADGYRMIPLTECTTTNNKELSGKLGSSKKDSKFRRKIFSWFIPSLDFTLLKEVDFFVACIANTFGLMGYYIPFVYLTDSSVAKGIPRDSAAFLISVTGISNIFGKLVMSWIMDKPNVHAMDVYNFCLIASGIAALTIPFCWTYTELLVIAAVYNFFGGVYVSVISLVLVDMIGVEKLTSSFGFMNMFRGIGSMTGSPLAGTVFDHTKSYDILFFIAGALLLLSATLTIGLSWINHSRRKTSSPSKSTNLPS